MGNTGGAASGFVGGGGIGNDGGTLNLSYLNFSGNTAAGGYGGAHRKRTTEWQRLGQSEYTMLSGDSAQYGGEYPICRDDDHQYDDDRRGGRLRRRHPERRHALR